MKKPVYKAPALDKGLEILELLAGREKPVGPTEIAQELGRSTTEIYRMLLVLEARAYIERSDDGRYQITERLFQLGMRNAPKRNLHAAALPVMLDLAERTGQSCHLAVISGDDIVVVARVESPGPVSFAVRLGYRVPLLESASGRVIFGFQSARRQAAWLQQLRRGELNPAALRKFVEEAKEVAARGYALEDSRLTEGIRDIGAPIFGPVSDDAIASLTMPSVAHRYLQVEIADLIPAVAEAAKDISSKLRGR